MAMVTKNPLCAFRAVSKPAAGVQATATTTAASAAATATGTSIPVLVIQDVTASVASGTNNQAPIAVNLIDGASGGTNVLWSAYLGAGTSASQAIAATYLGIKCPSGLATLEFAAAGGTLASQSVAMGGYYQGPQWE